jgi:peptide deformylase
MQLDDLALTIYGNPVLRRRTPAVDAFDTGFEALTKRMFEIMYESDGVGLAAPQAGVSLRVAVLDVPLADGGSYVGVLANPEILERRGEQKGPEGCLSIPGLSEDVTRAQWLRVRALDLQGRPFEFEATDLLARAVQHEVDHLDGVLYVDRVSPVRRRLLAKKLKKIAEERAARD